MDDNAKRKELATYLAATQGILDPANQENAIKKMAAACPAATAADKGLTTDIAKAYETMLIEKGQQQQPTNPTATVTPTPTLPTSGVSAQEELNIAQTLIKQHDDRVAVSTNTSIEKLVLDRPAPADIIKQGTKGVIMDKGWKNIIDKIEKGVYTVKPDDGDEIDASKRIASTTNFEQLKAAYAAGQPVEVMIGNLNTKPIGYIVNKGTATGSSQKPEQMTRSSLERFMIMDTAGYILASETKPGAKLRYVKAKVNAQNPGASTSGKTILADANKKDAIEAGSYVISKEVTSAVEPTNCKAALAFRVTVNGKKQKDNVTPLTRTIRVTVKADVPVLKRKAEFLDVFGTGERESNSQLLTPPTGKQAQDIEAAQRKAIAMLRQRALDPNMASSVADISNQLSAFGSSTQQSPAGVTL